MPSIKGSKTEKNLLTAFAGESQARNRYTYFAGIAKKEGFVQISKVFEETANHEKEHAKRYFKFLEGGELMIEYEFPAGILDSTVANLRAAAAGERFETNEMYPGFAAVAKEEGFPEVAVAFTTIAKAEAWHERRYTMLADSIDANEVFRKPGKVVWRCLNCGFDHEGLEAPAMCPACIHPQAHFEVYTQPW